MHSNFGYLNRLALIPGGRGGGGTLIFFSYVGSGPASTFHPKKSGISSTQKIFEILAAQKISPILYLDLKKRP